MWTTGTRGNSWARYSSKNRRASSPSATTTSIFRAAYFSPQICKEGSLVALPGETRHVDEFIKYEDMRIGKTRDGLSKTLIHLDICGKQPTVGVEDKMFLAPPAATADTPAKTRKPVISHTPPTPVRFRSLRAHSISANQPPQFSKKHDG